MMNFLYTITIYPLELAYRYVYLFCVELIGSYGLSLFVLAIISTMIYTPLKKMASKAQDKERRIQEIMAPQIKNIKQESTGSLQHKRISKLYYRYAYHPIFALRSIIGVALQLPFLCGAYYMLSTLPDIEGHSFGIIANLSKPDALLGSINALPILMTFFNIVATYASPNFSRKERLQAVVVALAFLVLLYNAPSALLLYWTANNALLCLQTIVSYKKLKPTKDKLAVKEAKIKPKTKVKIKEPVYVKALTLPLVALTTLLFIYVGIVAFYIFGMPNELMANSIIVSLLSLLPLIFFLRLPNTSKYWVIKALVINIAWLIVLVNIVRIATPITIPVISYTFEKMELNHNDLFFIIASILTWLSIIPLSLLPYLKYQARLKHFFANYEKGIYFSAMGTLGLLVIFFSPTALYISSPDFFQASLMNLLVDLVPYAVGYCLILTLVWFISPSIIKKYLAIFLLFITTLALINALLLNGNYGALDGLLFNNLEYFGSVWSVVFDLIAIVATVTLIICVHKYRLSSQLIAGLNLATCSLAIFYIAQIYTVSTPPNETKTENTEQNQAPTLPDYNDRLYGFSKTENNVMVFILDMFTAGDVPRILEKHPELKQRFSGFTWYEDTLAVGSGTVMSVPSIYAGPGYSPEMLNKKQIGEINSDKKAKSLSELSNQFNRHNYDVSILESPIIVSTEKITQHLDPEVMYIPKLDNIYTMQWMEKPGIPKIETTDMSHYMLAVSLFRIAPHKIKRNIYRDWQWFGVGKALFSNQNLYNTLSNTAAFALLPEVANNRSEKGTFKFIYSLFPHSPWHLPEDSLVPVLDPYPETEGQDIKVDGYYPEHYYTEQHLLLLLADFFDWMKANDVYDNTMIVLVADHDQADSVRLIFENNPLGPWVRPHALLMVKELNQHAPLQTSEALMSTSDVASMVCTIINGCDGIEPLQTSPQRVRKHFVAVDKQNADFFDTFIRYDEYTITGSMFEEKNWHLKPYKD